MNTYEQLAKERDSLARVVKEGRKGTVYHTVAVKRLEEIRRRIKQTVKDYNQNERKKV
jgi:hypothetical protein